MALASKTSFADNFNIRVHDYISSRIVWHSGNYPIPPDCPINIGITYMGSPYLNYMGPETIPGSILTASQVIGACVSLAQSYTRVREFQWVRRIYGNTAANGSFMTDIQISALNDFYNQPFSPAIDVTQGQLASLPYFSSLLDTWNATAHNRITYEYSKHDNWANHSRSRR